MEKVGQGTNRLAVLIGVVGLLVLPTYFWDNLTDIWGREADGFILFFVCITLSTSFLAPFAIVRLIAWVIRGFVNDRKGA